MTRLSPKRRCCAKVLQVPPWVLNDAKRMELTPDLGGHHEDEREQRHERRRAQLPVQHHHRTCTQAIEPAHRALKIPAFHDLFLRCH